LTGDLPGGIFYGMKTTIDISDAVLEETRRIAADERTTLRALVEEGLRSVIASRPGGRRFRLRDAAFHGGNGLRREFAEGGFERVRDTIYEGRGG
jgi:hypothetical protein